MMMQITLAFFTIFYLAIASCLFTHWQELMQQDVYMTSGQWVVSKVLLVVATIFWPIVVPFAYLELLLKSKKKQEGINIVLNQIDTNLYQK